MAVCRAAACSVAREQLLETSGGPMSGPHLLQLHLAGVRRRAVVQRLAGDAVRAVLPARAARLPVARLHRLPAGRPLVHARLSPLSPHLLRIASLLTGAFHHGTSCRSEGTAIPAPVTLYV